MATMTKAKFERSKFDIEKKGIKEGSPADIARDKKQMAAAKAKGYARGGGVESKGKTKGKNLACGGKVKK